MIDEDGELIGIPIPLTEQYKGKATLSNTGFIVGKSHMFWRPLDPREGNEWKDLGEVLSVEVDGKIKDQ
jgi:hypothetical protein